MNNNLLKELRFKVFQSGNPLYFYIGINVLVFILAGLLGVILFLSGSTGISLSGFIRDYFAFPADFSKMPWRFYTLITYQFFHERFFHILFNMLWLYWMGQIFMDFLNKRQFHFVYLTGGIAGALLYAAAYNIFPIFQGSVAVATLIGASASVMAIIVAAATLTPDYSIMLLFFGQVKIKYLAIAYFVLDIIGIASTNAGGSIAHIGGAIMGFVFIKQLQRGHDWSKFYKRRPRLKVVKNTKPVKKGDEKVSQQEIDAILDKISKAGYEKLTAEEKAKLFKASNNK